MTAMVEAEQHVEAELSDLVRRRRAELRLSLRGFAAACIDPATGEGGLIGHNWVDRLEKGTAVTPPQLPELRALATGLNLALPIVQEAAGAQFMGITPTYAQSGEARALVTYAEGMTEDQRRQLLAIVEAYDRSRTPR
ncbi:helix-turn-helix domain-containing protein [Streptomyces sp. NBC_00474]|uniref:helix-turn-helix domain-containing protein n=1 Tax=Streptomyces sp. NBC_00474 TaxID=2975754 RepID=UPI00224CA8F4|nr:helix-turn-helix domain-containing protein [Streptomyces sp. NBC_00474]MCX5050979.1 helix-turn-helix domain-containing protein [Streptomyces sp. NBC_00474]